MSICLMEAGCGCGPKMKDGREIPRKWRILVVTGEIYRSAGARNDPVASRRFVACQFGSLRRKVGGAKNEGRVRRLSRKWRILVVKSEIYRSLGPLSDPVASRWFRIFFLFVVFVVSCQFGSWVRVVGGRQKWRTGGEINAKMADCARKSRNVQIRGDP